MKKKISIIIATYNAETTLERCLESIISQKTEDIEILVIDGLSTDKTMDVVRSKGNQIDFSLSERDEGIYDAWNKAIKESHGEWIMFLGADDYLMKGSVRIYLDFISHIDRNEIDIVCALGQFCNFDGKVIKEIGKPYNYDKFKKYMNVVHGAMLHNSNLFRELGPFNVNYKICADYDFLLRRPLRAEFINQPLIRIQTGGVSFSVKMLVETFWIKRDAKCSPLLADCYYFFKGLVSLEIKKLIQKIILVK